MRIPLQIEDLVDTSLGGLDFQGYMAIAMSCDNGDTFPTSPDLGQWFLHTPAGRNYLYMYNGTEWTAIISLGSTTVYVDFTSGSDTQDKGFGTGSDAYASIEYAVAQIPPIFDGSVVVEAAGGTYTSDTILPSKVAAAGGTITINGADMTVVQSIISTGVVKGTGATQGSVTLTGAGWTTDQHMGKMLYNTVAGDRFVIEGNTSDTIRIVGTFSNTPVIGDVFEIQTWSTILSNASGFGLNISNNSAASFNINNISIAGANPNFAVFVSSSASGTSFTECYMTSLGTAGTLNVVTSNVSLSKCSINSGSFSACMLTAQNGFSRLLRTLVYSPTVAGTGVNTTSGSHTRFNTASTVKGFVTGISVESTGASFDGQFAAANGYQRVMNCTTGISYAGMNFTPNANWQFSGNTTDYVDNFTVYRGLTVFNENGDPAGDTRMESDTEANMFFLDASADKMYFGGTTNGMEIGKGGEMTLIGTATVWDDLRIEPVSRSTGAKAPSFANWINGLYLYDFDNAVVALEKELFFTVQLPHGWKEGSAVEPHVHWVNKTAGTAGQVVRWGLEYTKSVIGGTFGASTTVYGTTIAGGGDITVANEHLLTDFASIDMTGDTISTVLVCRIFRNSSDAADTYTGTAGLLYIDWHVELNSMGSKTELAK